MLPVLMESNSSQNVSYKVLKSFASFFSLFSFKNVLRNIEIEFSVLDVKQNTQHEQICVVGFFILSMCVFRCTMNGFWIDVVIQTLLKITSFKI